MGHGFYNVPKCPSVEIDLKLKRSYEIANGDLKGYYDDNTANDELLVSYLAQNKDAVLGDIIATIQKEQNVIIRRTPFRNMFIQGAVGSGKTTVAMHHLSYILYNYGKDIQPYECCMIGSNHILLSYIASGLPELDINDIQTQQMDAFFVSLLGKYWKKKHTIIPQRKDCRIKSRLSFVLDLKSYIDQKWSELLRPQDISDSEFGILLSHENQIGTVKLNTTKSVVQVCSITIRVSPSTELMSSARELISLVVCLISKGVETISPKGRKIATMLLPFEI